MSEKFENTGGEENKTELSKERLIEKLSRTPIEDLIKLYPELGEKVEAIRLADGKDPISLLRTKKNLTVAYAVWSKAYTLQGEKHGVYLDVPEQDLDKKDRKLEFKLIASCCHPEVVNAGKPPFGDFPSYSKMYPGADKEKDEKSANLGQIGLSSGMIRFRDFERAEDDWRKKYNEEWINPKQKEFSEAIQTLCEQNGIKEVIMETPTGDNNKYYDDLKDIKIVETDEDYVIKS